MDRLDQLAMAKRVRDEHRDGVCDECLGVGPCRRYATWFPIIAELPRAEPAWPSDPESWWL